MFSKIAALYYIPTSGISGFQFPHSCYNIIIYLFYYSHPNRHEVVTHCGFDLRFLMAHSVKHPFLCLLVIFASFFFFWDRVSLLLPRLECNGAISAHRSLRLLGSGNSLALASWVAGITGAHHDSWLIFVFLVEMIFYHVGQAGLKLLTASNPPASASHSAGLLEWATVPDPGRQFFGKFWAQSPAIISILEGPAGQGPDLFSAN